MERDSFPKRCSKRMGGNSARLYDDGRIHVFCPFFPCCSHGVQHDGRYDNVWEGLATRDLLIACRPRDEARFVVLHSHDGYTTNLALEDFAAEDALLAHSWSGQPLEQEHGGPVRLVVPHLYFWKSAKWLQSIEFLDHDVSGYWEVRGYHNRGDPWAEQRYSDD